MSKKVIVIAAVIVLILIGIVGFILLNQKKSVVSTIAQNNPAVQPTQVVPTQAAPDFAKAMQGTGSVKCTYTSGAMTGTTYIKDGKVRFEGTTAGVTNNSIMINKVVYSWATGSKTGFMMDTSTISVTITPGAAAQKIKGADAIKNDLMNYKPTCTNETIPDTLFDKPTDVTFSDMSKMINNAKSLIPANVTIPAGVKIPQQ